MDTREEMLDYAIKGYKQEQYTNIMFTYPNPECHVFSLPWEKVRQIDAETYLFTLPAWKIIYYLRLPSDPMTVNERWKVIHDR